MQIQKVFIWLSMVAGLFMAAVSLLGISDPGTYHKETRNWAAQAVGQDYVNLAVAFPVLVVSSAIILVRDSFKAFLVWLGALMYLIYSYILYSFFVHFGPLFLFYVAILSLSFYSFVGGLVTLDWQGISARFSDVKTRPASVLLGIVAILFTLLWLIDIIGAVVRGGTPADLEKTGLVVNPIHVLDLSLLLPGALVVAVLLLRRNTLGFVLAVPFLVFFALMGLAIISMMIVTAQRGFALAFPQMVAISAIVIASLVITAHYLRRVTRT